METRGLPGSSSSSSDEASQRPRKRRRHGFVVEIRPRPKYVPGSGPALQPPRLLLLPSSSTATAYIIERILLPSPGLAADGRPLPKRMTYIVGWHDLPAASLLVPAMDILDYVSPGTLECWEEGLEAEVERQQQQQLLQTARGAKESRPSLAHRSRPPAHTDIEQAAAVEPTAGDEPQPPKKGSMSLSTPQKRKLADFEDLSDDEEGPSSQLARELFDTNPRTEPVQQSYYLDHIEDDRVRPGSANHGVVAAVPVKKAIPTVTPVPLPSYVSKMVSLGEVARPVKTGMSVVRLDMGDAVYPGPTTHKVRSVEGNTLINSFSPINRGRSSTASSRTRSSTRASQRSDSLTNSPKDAPQAEAEARGRKKRRSPPPPAADRGEASWEVDRLENLASYEVQGRGIVRYFLVRWAGKWPPDQKTTWEPEENIPKDLVRRYMELSRDRRARLAAESSSKPPPEQVGLAPGRRRGSVSAVFEECIIENPGFGDDDDDGDGADLGPGLGLDRPGRGRGTFLGESDMDHEVFVVDGGGEPRGAAAKQTPMPLPTTTFRVF
ncbi:Chromo domain-like protein [Moelleriella libera RCEF 2490]|uniref:Chromo domain-like protein n=1 Tax=Moelleriella libera RCEF 2490 TaxID=1081109 RepID=A0A167XUG4_9HYPO|nr:Chromo domain-like protein [Moelleriella libera RCEF 2490]